MIQKPEILELFKMARPQLGIKATPVKPPIEWIGTDDDFYPNRIDRDGTQYKAEVIVCHVMAGSLVGTDQWFNNEGVDVSTTFGIGLKGQIHQYVDVKHGAWGNGDINRPSWTGFKYRPDGSRVNPNLYTISVEFEGNHPNAGTGQFWAPTEAQIQAAIKLFAWLCWEYGIPVDRLHIIGHFELNSVSRPHCPGPRFPFDRIISEVKKLVVKEAITAMFTDMNGHWAKAVVEEVAKRKTPQGSPVITGVANGDGTFKFMPDEPLTRAQAAVLCARLLAIIDAK